MILLVAVLLSWVLVGLFIRLSRERGWGQPIRIENPQSHQVKVGTPTAGGVPFTLALALVFFGLYFGGQIQDPRELLIMLTALGMGVIGGIDDWLKIQWQRNGGKTKKELLAREKFPMQLLVSIAFAWFAVPLAAHNLVPSLGGLGSVPIWDLLLLTFVMLGSANAFNFTDGIDGQLAGVAMITLLPLIAISPVSALLVAVLIGYLWFNAYPAQIFMGDMGSHAIGAIVAGAYILYADVWLLPVAALIPVLEVISVIIQVIAFQMMGKRIFRKTPFHHHFEELDTPWPETRIATRFWMVTALMTFLAWNLLKSSS